MTSHPIAPNLAARVLVASSSAAVQRRVFESLSSRPQHFEQAKGGAEALDRLESGCWQMLFLDRRLPDRDAEELRETVRLRFPGVEVVLIDPESDSELDSKFSSTFLSDDTSRRTGIEQETRLVVHTWPAEIERGRREEDSSMAPGIPCIPLPGMVGSSRSMHPVYRLGRLLAPRNTAVLITGPTGCGKEMVARAIHQLSPRSGRPFVVRITSARCVESTEVWSTTT